MAVVFCTDPSKNMFKSQPTVPLLSPLWVSGTEPQEKPIYARAELFDETERDETRPVSSPTPAHHPPAQNKTTTAVELNTPPPARALVTVGGHETATAPPPALAPRPVTCSNPGAMCYTPPASGHARQGDPTCMSHENRPRIALSVAGQARVQEQWVKGMSWNVAQSDADVCQRFRAVVVRERAADRVGGLVQRSSVAECGCTRCGSCATLGIERWMCSCCLFAGNGGGRRGEAEAEAAIEGAVGDCAV